jgi:hypothetical protein
MYLLVYTATCVKYNSELYCGRQVMLREFWRVILLENGRMEDKKDTEEL